jgi:hypothetical protein
MGMETVFEKYKNPYQHFSPGHPAYSQTFY